MKNLTFIDLFAGAGGFSLGLSEAGLKGIFAVERDKMAFSTIDYNLIEGRSTYFWPDWLPKSPMDIRSLIKNFREKLQTLTDSVDLVVGGPPCQGFSLAGRRVEHDQRNAMFNEYVLFVKLVKPRMILFENVPAFSFPFKNSGKKESTYADLLKKKLKRIGYEPPVQKVFNFSEYGIPQSRKRLIIYSAEKGTDPTSFFERVDSKKRTNNKTSTKDAISDLRKSLGVAPTPDYPIFESGLYGTPESPFQRRMRSSCHLSLPDSHRFARHRKEVESRFVSLLEKAERNKSISRELRAEFGLKKRNIIPLAAHSPSPTLTTLPDDYIHYEEPRILTVREYARLQTFPDWFEFKGKYTTGGKLRSTEVPRYTQVANAIPPDFTYLLGSLLPS